MDPENWKDIRWGVVSLKEGKYSLKVEALNVANETAMELRNVIVTKVD